MLNFTLLNPISIQDKKGPFSRPHPRHLGVLHLLQGTWGLQLFLPLLLLLPPGGFYPEGVVQGNAERGTGKATARCGDTEMPGCFVQRQTPIVSSDPVKRAPARCQGHLVLGRGGTSASLRPLAQAAAPVFSLALGPEGAVPPQALHCSSWRGTLEIPVSFLLRHGGGASW